MRTLILILLMVCVPVASGTFQPTDERDFWANVSSLDLKFLKSFISNESCYRDQAHENACLKGLKAARPILVQLGLTPQVIEALVNPLPTLPGGLVDYDNLILKLDAAADKKSKAMMYGIMASSVLTYFDPHARLVPSALLVKKLGGSSMDYRGTGLDIEITLGGVYVRKVPPASPVSRKGIRVNDRIVAINGKPLEGGMKAHETWQTYRSANPEEVTFELERGGTVTVPLGIISTPMLEGRTLKVRSLKGTKTLSIGWIVVRNFTDRICENLESEINRLRYEEKRGDQDLHAIFLDLRGNVGGITEEGVCAASLFLGGSTILWRTATPVFIPKDYGLNLEEFPSPARMTGKQRLTASFGSIPLIVLQNAQTGSASEIVSAALQDNDRAWIVGELSSGKGSGQLLTPLRPGLRIGYTTAENFRPNGDSLQLNGVTPNFEAPFNPRERRQYLREIDLFPNSFRPRLKADWRERRPEAARIRLCANEKILGISSRMVYRELGYFDFQMATAVAILNCDLAQHND